VTKTLEVDNPIAVALDGRDLDALREIATRVGPHVGVFKIGLTTFSVGGPDFVRELAATKPVFLDLKLHDIPAQVEGAVAAIAELGVSFVTVHASGGVDMIKAAAAASGDDLRVLAVTVLTSLDDAALLDLGNSAGASATVDALADAAMRGGTDGLVCSPLEVGNLRGRYGPHGDGGPFLVTPGIRPAGSDAGDQRRTTDPRGALDAGSDLLVIGRPITAAPDPAAAARSVGEELAR
jgi:orotidine-5'-phosphate decarboxylase